MIALNRAMERYSVVTFFAATAAGGRTPQVEYLDLSERNTASTTE
jgi:hypothetical protein